MDKQEYSALEQQAIAILGQPSFLGRLFRHEADLEKGADILDRLRSRGSRDLSSLDNPHVCIEADVSLLKGIVKRDALVSGC